MAAINTTSTLQIFKEVYGSFDIVDLCKQEAKLAKRKKLEEAEMLGKQFVFPVRLTQEHGYTYASAGTLGSTTLIASNVAQVSQAIVDGNNLVGRSQIDYEAVAKATSGNDKKAFAQATGSVVKGLAEAGIKRLESQFLHGQKGIGVVSAIVNINATSSTITISDDTWSAATWSGESGGTFDVWNAGLTAQIGTGSFTLSAINMTTKSFVLTGAAGDITALGVAGAGVNMFWASASPTTEFAGIDKILNNTGSLFGISAATYENWAGNSAGTALGTLSVRKLLAALALPCSFGLSKDVLAVIAPKGFEVLNSDESALRVYDASYKSSEGENGTSKLLFHAQSGSMEVMAHPLQKDGYFHMFPVSEWHRIGATDLSFVKRQGSQDALILELSNTAAAEMRTYSNQAIVLEAPRHGVTGSGITY